MITLTVDDKKIQAEEGTFLLKACLDNDIYIPNLCFIETIQYPNACCRLCFVEIEGEKEPVTSCTIRVCEGMNVRTDTPTVRRLQKAAFNLIISAHEIYATCPMKEKCELTKMAKFLGMKFKPVGIKRLLKPNPIRSDHPLFDFYVNRCVLCEKCIHVCREKIGNPILTFAKRGFDTTIAYFGEKNIENLPCSNCFACVNICPVGAIVQRANL